MNADADDFNLSQNLDANKQVSKLDYVCSSNRDRSRSAVPSYVG